MRTGCRVLGLLASEQVQGDVKEVVEEEEEEEEGVCNCTSTARSLNSVCP